jgi:nucleotide-binding universal stress UspA family protein
MYKKIMVPLDGSELAECVLPHVEELCRGNGDRVIYLVRVVEPFQPYVGDYVIDPREGERIDRENIASATKYLDKVSERLLSCSSIIEKKVLLGRVAECLVDYARDEEMELIVIATHGRSGVSRWVRGSIADRILHFSYVPILMIRAPWIEET